MWNQQLLVLFLKALLAARKSLSLYPSGSEMATAWVQRLHGSLHGFFQQGLTFPIRISKDRFQWAGEDLLTVDPTLETFRFELESRGIAEFSIDPKVSGWELQAFLELLNQPPGSLESLKDAAAYLRARNVVYVSVAAPTAGVRGDTGADQSWSDMETGKDTLDLFVETVLGMVEERFADLVYDREGLRAWFEALAAGDRVDLPYSAVKMLSAMAEGGGDREVRTRTMAEALILLPEPILRPLLTKWVVPLASTDLAAFNLLTQLTEDELAMIARLVPQEQLLSLTSDLLEFHWEEGKRRRLLEAITATIGPREEPAGAGGPILALSRDDPLLVELRQEIVAACEPAALLERSTEILLALTFHVESDEYSGFTVDALEETVGEALARGRLDLAVRVLSSLGSWMQRGGPGMRDQFRRLSLLRRRVGSRTHIALVAGILRREVTSEQQGLAAEYLRLIGSDAAEEFVALLAEERDRRVRARMCQVLARVGASVIPVLLQRLEDRRWFVVRNVLYILGRIASESTMMSVVSALDHPHARVRAEAARALALVGGGAACHPLLRCVSDGDPTVRVAVVRALGSVRNDAAVPGLRDVLTRPAAAPGDLEIKREVIHALVTIGSPAARGVLAELAARRAWFWKRSVRRVRNMAVAALAAGTFGEVVSAGEIDDDE